MLYRTICHLLPLSCLFFSSLVFLPYLRNCDHIHITCIHFAYYANTQKPPESQRMRNATHERWRQKEEKEREGEGGGGRTESSSLRQEGKAIAKFNSISIFASVMMRERACNTANNRKFENFNCFFTRISFGFFLFVLSFYSVSRYEK